MILKAPPDARMECTVNATMKELGLDKLSNEERIALADELWKSVDEETEIDFQLTDVQKAELSRRITDLETNPADVVSWEQIRDEALARFRK